MFLAAGARRLDRLDLGDAVSKQHVTTVRVRPRDSCTNCTNGAATQRLTSSQPRRPSGPRLLLAMARGRHKIFLGMAAGVGKTYRMLQEGQAEAEAGRDVVIGYLETHDRPDTTEQAAGLERIPRRGFTYRGNRIEEMNLPGVLERAPELVLIDELAHTNAPGGEHAKRYEDVEDVLAAGDRRLLDGQRPASGEP